MSKKTFSVAGKTGEEIIDACLEDDPMVPGPIPCWIPTGCSQLDWAIGGNGYPTGRLLEMYGGESAGKSLLAMLGCRNALRMGGSAVYLDMESAFNEEWATKLGLPSESLIIRTPECLEEVHDIIETIVSNHKKFAKPCMIVWDSLAASASRASCRKKSAKDIDPIGAEARLNGSFFRRTVLKNMRNLPICLLVINQVRDKIGGNPYDNETTPGGRAIKFYASLRLAVKRTRIMKPKRPGELPKGAFIRVKAIKNKIARPYMIADFPIYFNRGVDDVYAILYYAEMLKVIPVTQQGRVVWKDKAYTRSDYWRYLNENPKEFEELKTLCKDNFYSESPLGTEAYDTEESE